LSNNKKRRLINLNSRIGITGSPGTGKKTIANCVAELSGLRLVSINEKAMGLNAGRWINGEFTVNVNRLVAKIDTRGAVTFGHLLPYVLKDQELDFVIVLRCSPSVLRKRLGKRQYSQEKIEENIQSEVLDILLTKALDTFGTGKVYEFDTTRRTNPKKAAKDLLKMLNGGLRKRRLRANWAARVSSPSKLRNVMGWNRY
jgi:adenylate kinase